MRPSDDLDRQHAGRTLHYALMLEGPDRGKMIAVRGARLYRALPCRLSVVVSPTPPLTDGIDFHTKAYVPFRSGGGHHFWVPLGEGDPQGWLIDRMAALLAEAKGLMDYAALRANDGRLVEAMRLHDEGFSADEIARRLDYENAASVRAAIRSVQRDLDRSEAPS